METLALAKSFVQGQNYVLLTNSIDLELFTEVPRNPNGPWLIISRLDPFKVEGIKDFLIKLDSYGAQNVIIVGDGPSFEDLRHFSQTELSKTKVEFLGARYDILPIFKNEGIAGIGGMGRVVLEGMASNLPTMLVGYDGVKGLVEANNVDIAAWWNFSGRGLPSISQFRFNSIMGHVGAEECRLREWVMENANSLKIWKQYRNLIDQLTYKAPQEVNGTVDLIWEAIKRNFNSSTPYLENLDFLFIFKSLLNNKSEMGVSSKFFTSVINSLNQGASLLQMKASQLLVEKMEIERSLEEYKREVARLSEENEELRRELSKSSSQYEVVAARIREIESSRMWKVTRMVWNIRQKVLPSNSRRAKIIRKISLLFGKPKNYKTFEQQIDIDRELGSNANSEITKDNIDLWAQIRSRKVLRKGRIIPVRSSPRKRVAYFTNQLLDWHDERPRYGGGERYCVTLSNLLQDLGFDVDIYQVASHPFVGEYEGFRVTAIPFGRFYSEFNVDATKKFFEISLSYDHVIYNLPEYSSGPMRIDAISICHGIWFDHTFYGNFWTNEWFERLYRAFKNPKRIISVDTNSINVVRAFWPELAQKFIFIPNFVDHSVFNREGVLESKDKDNDIVVLFPRRANPARGALIVKDILRFVQHDHVQFYWVGEGDGPFNQYLIELSNFDTRFKFLTASFHDMPNWYRKADIVVIPTLGSEGTSLSCLEAIASGCAVIVTNVGGLTDIIRNGWNGLVVSPNPKEIAKAINRLIEDDRLRRELSERAYLSSYEFSLEKWKNAWTEVFYEEGWLPRLSSSSIVAGRDLRLVIVTKNAIHGGVETLIALEAKYLNATVIVAGGYNDPFNTCPFNYKYVSTYEELIKVLREYDVVLYHWPTEWAVQAIRDCGLPSVEFVHREDTSELDKSVPDLIVTHSKYLASKLENKTGRSVFVIPHGLEITRTMGLSDKVENQKKTIVGMITSYEETKGIDVFIAAWAMIAKEFPSYKAVLYGAGSKIKEYMEMAKQLGIDVEFNKPTSRVLEVLSHFALLIHPSRVEGLPLTILEALSLNIPVIASDIEGHIQINLIAEENGFDPPLILFETNNAEDLAKKIRDVLRNPARKVTSDFVESCFSPQAHVEPLRSILFDLRKRPKKTQIFYDCIDYSLNEGVFCDSESAEGFLFTSGGGRVSTRELPLISTSDEYLSYRYPVPEGVEYIECKINVQEVLNVILNLRFDWYYKDQILAQNYYATVPGEGILYARVKVPSGLFPQNLMITIIPPAGQIINVRELEIRALKQRESCIQV